MILWRFRETTRAVDVKGAVVVDFLESVVTLELMEKLNKTARILFRKLVPVTLVHMYEAWYKNTIGDIVFLVNQYITRLPGPHHSTAIAFAQLATPSTYS